MFKLSLITINLDNKKGLEKTIQSISKQTFRNFEYIVIDGDSSDGSTKLIEKYRNHISLSVSEKDTGIYNAMNKGILNARGVYCMFLNSGDYLYDENTLQNVFESNPDEDILYGNSVVINHTNNTYLIKEPDNLTFKRLYTHSICHQAMFIKRNLFSPEKFGLYREDLKIASDWDFNVRAIILGRCSLKHLPFSIVYYDFKGISNQNTDLSLHEREIILNELIPDRILKDIDNLVKLENELDSFKRTLYYKLLKRISKYFDIKII